jgi:glycosyltransferase involved in cell wall biosynthesis
VADDHPLPGLFAALTTFESMRTVERALASLRGLCERIVVIDSGSTDGTVEVCRQAGALVQHQAWLGQVAQKQLAIDRCEGARWVLLLDSDESLEPPLQRSLREALSRDEPAIAGYELNRKLWFLGGWLHHAFQPEWRLRVIRRGRGRVVGSPPHDRMEADGLVRRLAGDLRHDSWVDARDMLRRQLEYARVAAEQDATGGGLLDLLVRPSAAFLKQSLLRRGLLDGRRGLVASGGAAAASLMKHLLLMARRTEAAGGDRDLPRTNDRRS